MLVLLLRFVLCKPVVLECAFACVILVLCYTAQVLDNAQWPAIQLGHSGLQTLISFILSSLLN